MRRRFAVASLVSVLVLAWSGPALARGSIAAGAAMILAMQAEGESILDATVPLDDAGEEFFRSFVAGAAGLSVTGAVRGNPDPVIDYTLEVANSSELDASMTFLILMPIVPLLSVSAVSASLDIAVADDNGSGSAFVGTLNPTIQQSVISEDGIAATSLGVDVGTGVFNPGGLFSAGPVPGPTPNPAVGPVFTHVAIIGGFRLSAGDSAVLTGNLTVVPEPSAAWLLSAGVLALAGLRSRPRRRA